MDQTKQRAYSGSRWEEQAAYCRAIRSGPQIAVSGTTAVNGAGEVVGGDVHDQAIFVFTKIRTALRDLGADLDDVVRTRTFLTDMRQLDGFIRAHRETFGGLDPAATCVEVSGLVDDRLLIEVEVDAFQP
ncbi:MAG: RidA family protein [Pseudomonadales bacterium]|nr:RidA family protein [Pseudomonadales bacterium]